MDEQQYQLPCKLGDDLYCVSKVDSEDVYGRAHIIEVGILKHGVQQITIKKDGVYVQDGSQDGPGDLLGTDYACLTHDEAYELAKQKYPDSYIIDPVAFPHKTIRVLVSEPGCAKEVREIPCSESALEELVCPFVFVGEEDENHILGLVSKNAKRMDEPLNCVVYDKEENVVDVIYGTLVLVQTEILEDGTKTLGSLSDANLELLGVTEQA